MTEKITLEDIKKELEDIENYINSLYKPLDRKLSRIEQIPKTSFKNYYKQIDIIHKESKDLYDRLYELRRHILENYDIHDDEVNSVLTSVTIVYGYIDTILRNLEYFKMKMRTIEDSTTIEDFLF